MVGSGGVEVGELILLAGAYLAVEGSGGFVKRIYFIISSRPETIALVLRFPLTVC